MSTMLMNTGALLVDDGVRRDAERFVGAAQNRAVRGVRVVLEDGSEQSLAPALAELVGHVLNGAASGSVTVTVMPDELTTTQAADLLGVSRPTLMKLIADHALPAHKVGSHTRLGTSDVLALKGARRAQRAAAFMELRAFDEASEGVTED